MIMPQIPWAEYQLFFCRPRAEFYILVILVAGFNMTTFLTVVDVYFTVPSSEAAHTVTLVVVLLVEAGSVLAGGTEADN